jgi:hypothetical protein
VEVDFNPAGHGPTDGKGGGYGVAHFDVHFFLKPWDRAARARIAPAASYSATGGAAAAEAEEKNISSAPSGAEEKKKEKHHHHVYGGTVDSMAPFLLPPPAALLPADGALVLDPDSLVPGQGAHWVPSADWERVYRTDTHTGVLGAWSGLSFMVGTFNGSVTFAEQMVSLAKLGDLAAGRRAHAEEGSAVPQPAGPAEALAAAWGAHAAYPASYFVAYDNATDAYAFGWRFGATSA